MLARVPTIALSIFILLIVCPSYYCAVFLVTPFQLPPPLDLRKDQRQLRSILDWRAARLRQLAGQRHARLVLGDGAIQGRCRRSNNELDGVCHAIKVHQLK